MNTKSLTSSNLYETLNHSSLLANSILNLNKKVFFNNSLGDDFNRDDAYYSHVEATGVRSRFYACILLYCNLWQDSIRILREVTDVKVSMKMTKIENDFSTLLDR